MTKSSRISAISQLRQRFVQAGFTMIELLIVIAILGILAVAVLSAINPIEQINRGRDTGSRSDAEQLLGAIDRYNAFQGYYPWQDDAQDQTLSVGWAQIDDQLSDNSGTCPIYEKLSTDQGSGCTGADELKATFFNRLFSGGAENALFIYNEGGQGDSTYVCFSPRSKAFLTEAKVRCETAQGAGLPSDLSGAADEVCGGYDTDDVYVCLP